MQKLPDNLSGFIPGDVVPQPESYARRELLELQAEILARKTESLKLYEPQAIPEEFHKCTARDRLVVGGNRCLAGWEMVYDPVAKVRRRVDQIDGDFHVLTVDPESGREVVAMACQPFVKAFGSIYRITLSSGDSFCSTLHHRVVAATGRWVSIIDAYQNRTAIYRNVAESALREQQEYDERKTRRNRVSRRSCAWALSCRAQQPSSDQPAWSEACETAFWASHPHLLNVGNNGYVYITNVEYECEGYIWDFTVDGTHNYLHGGVCHANSGKSVCSFVEDARAVTNQDPYNKYPKEGVLVILGFGWEHCGKVVWPMLFRNGAFKIIKDLETGQWRAFRPQTDWERRDEAKPSPPLIPHRFIKGGMKHGVAWVNKKLRQFSRIDLTTGWTIYYCASEGDPEQAQGFQANLVHVDEDVKDRRWIEELFARLPDRSGCFYWSAKPNEDQTGALQDLIDRADSESDLENPGIKMFRMSFLDNPYISDEEKKVALGRYAALGEDVVRMRVFGEAGESYLMYPNFRLALHGMNRDELPQGQIPHNWTRYMVVDPGHTVCAVLFAAVPPTDNMVLLYDELYLRQCDAPMFGEAVSAKVTGYHFHAFIIDEHGGNLADLSTGGTWRQVLSNELKGRNIRSQVSRHGFLSGCDDIEARVNSVRLMLYDRPGHGPRLRVLRGALPNFVREIQRYRKQVDARTKQIIDKPYQRGATHLMDCLGYLAAYDPMYYEPPDRSKEPSAAVKRFRAKMRRRNGGASNSVALY